MKCTIVATALLASLGLCSLAVPSQALPIAPAGMASGADTKLIQVRSSHRHMRRHRMRQGSASRGQCRDAVARREGPAIRPDDRRSTPLTIQDHH